MNLLKRLTKATAHVEECVATLEDPEVIVPQLMRQMEDHVQRATQSEARALADLKLAECVASQVRAQIESLGRGARFALHHGNEEMARLAVTAQVEAEGRLLEKEASLARAHGRLENARRLRQRLQSQLVDMREKKRDLVARIRLARLRGQLGGFGGRSPASITNLAIGLEGRVDEAETRPTTPAAPHATQHNAIVEERLTALRTSVRAE
jgi:phage shock protein A